MVTNELLHKAFSVFGTVEKAIILLDERGSKSKVQSQNNPLSFQLTLLFLLENK